MFGKLVGLCAGATTSSTLTDLSGIGTDPVFNVRSSLYKEALNAADWWVVEWVAACAVRPLLQNQQHALVVVVRYW
jgi:hypothetical protein